MFKRLLPVLFCLFLPFSDLLALHIVGGGITYECLGNGRYRFTMKVYRDGNTQGGAELDQEVVIGIYRCPPSGCSGLTQASAYGVVRARLQLPVVQVEKPDYPCLIPPNVRVEEGTYVWEAELPVSDQSYHITYQRCCRNVTISNLINPRDQGSTYTVELTPEAQAVCNSSPRFKQFPPTIICADEPLMFDHGAIDADGDQLVYEFCAPLDGGGGGAFGTRADIVNTCQGAAPQPGCPPPYREVTFRAPAYTFDKPLAGRPTIEINPNTGMITGTPTAQGQFVVGVCVSEFRNGVLMSRTYRDFQFNVASCDPQVVADIQEDIQISDQEYQVNSCGVTDISFVNESFQERFIREYEWSFDIEGETVTSREWEPTLSFPDIGEYEGTLILNPDTECGDTALITVNIYPDISADFVYEYDTCQANPVAFTDRSESGSRFINEWTWAFGDGEISKQQNPEHLYRSPGDIPVSLTVRDTNQCEATSIQEVSYFPVPNLIVIAPSAFAGCQPLGVFFDNLSFPIDSTYDIRWDFGDGGTSSAISPTYTYPDPGLFTVDVAITSPIGCKTDTTFPDLIRVSPSPVAGFSFTPEVPTNLDSRVSFFDESEDANSWYWDFGGAGTSRERSPTFAFPDTGRYVVTQRVTHPSGCVDTLARLVDVRPEVRFFLPNAFTPNADSVNDEYLGVGIMKGARNFNMSIWNRWGQKVFEATDPLQGWNGRAFNTGKDAPAGVYVVLVTFKGPRGEPFEYKQFATLIR